jgi:hypothetical protein
MISNNGVKVGLKADFICHFGKMSIPHTPNKFNALQYHIHTFSEHQIEGQGDNGFFPAELHVVHQEETEESYAVFGTMISVGADDHPVFEWFLQGWEAVAQKVEDSCVESGIPLDEGTHNVVQTLECPAIGERMIYNGTKPNFPSGETPSVYELPTDTAFGIFTYKGGLTTPGCTEIVNWNLLDTPMEISAEQLLRLEFLILCYVQTSYKEDGVTLKSCAHGTVADAAGSTSRPPQPLLGRKVIHRCPNGPAVTIDDVGVLPPDQNQEVFVKPGPVEEPLNTGESKCSRGLFSGCSDEPRYNPEVSPNLRANAPEWNDVAGFWVGTLSAYDANGELFGPTFAKDGVKNTIPYPRDDVMVFLNRTVSQTRLYEHTYFIYHPADAEFCDLPVPSQSTNVLGSGVCNENGHAAYSERFGVATFEKDGTAAIFAANGRFVEREVGVQGSTFPVLDRSVYTSLGNKHFELTETQTFTNPEHTKLSGTGQYLIYSSSPPYSENPLAETFSYNLKQVTSEDYATMLFEAYDSAKVPAADRIPLPAGNCIGWGNGRCPTEDEFQAIDPAFAESPYQEDANVSGGFIFLFVLIGAVVLLGGFIGIQRKLSADQAARYQEEFAKRIAATINFTGTHEKLTPEVLQAEFARMDKDGDGVLSKKELHAFMGDTMDDRDFEAMFAAIDLDHSNTIEFAEFCGFMSHIAEAYDARCANQNNSENA